MLKNLMKPGSNRRGLYLGGLVAALFALALPVLAFASTPTTDVRFSPQLQGKVNVSDLMVDPQVQAWTLTTKGSASPLGDFDYKSDLRIHYGIDGELLSITDGVGAFTGKDGDAIYFTLSGVFEPNTAKDRSDGQVTFDAIYIVTGGAGRFYGITGSGRIKGTADLKHHSFVGDWDGPARTLTR
jgi:hypothetical protein